jgi:hypothetical protein
MGVPSPDISYFSFRFSPYSRMQDRLQATPQCDLFGLIAKYLSRDF